MSYLLTSLLCAAVYLTLTQSLALNNLATALAIGALAAALTRPRGAGLPLRRLPRALVALAIYVPRLIVDIVKCGITVAGFILDPKLPIRPGIIAVKSHSNDVVTALSAHAITVTPGEQVLEIGDDGTMYTHCLDAVSSGAGADAAQSARKKLLDEVFA
jgi:multicomponent Na+:H+ antiporter subunit E